LSLTAVLFGAGPQHSIAAHAASTKPSTSQARPPGGPPLVGTIKSVTASSLTPVQSGSKKTIQVHLTAKTTYIVKGKPASSKPTLRTGEKVRVMATKVQGVLQARGLDHRLRNDRRWGALVRPHRSDPAAQIG
jgi:hypothetical protein